MKQKTAEINLSAQEMADAVAAHIARERLTKAHAFNTYSVEIRIHDGRLDGAIVRYYLEEVEDAHAELVGRYVEAMKACDFSPPFSPEVEALATQLAALDADASPNVRR